MRHYQLASWEKCVLTQHFSQTLTLKEQRPLWFFQEQSGIRKRNFLLEQEVFRLSMWPGRGSAILSSSWEETLEVVH